MTRNYINGFMSKMAEYGVRRDIAEQLLIKSAVKSPTEENSVGSISLEDPRGLPPQSRSPDSVNSKTSKPKPVSKGEMQENVREQLTANMTPEQKIEAMPGILAEQMKSEQPASAGVEPGYNSDLYAYGRSPETAAAEAARTASGQLESDFQEAQEEPEIRNPTFGGMARGWSYKNRGALGAAGGALAAGSLGAYLAHRLTKNKKNRRRNAIIAALAAGGLGGVGGYYGARSI